MLGLNAATCTQNLYSRHNLGVEPSESEMRAWLRAYVDEHLAPDQLSALAARFNDTIVELVPELADHELRRDLEGSTAAQIRLFLGGVADNLRPPEPPAEARDLARSIARRGLELRVLMKTYHAGHQAGVRFLADTIAAAGLEQDFERAVMWRLYARTSEWLNDAIEHLTDTYTEERERGLRDAFTRRAETVRVILAGDDVEIGSATAQLGYRLAGRHLSCVVWADGAADDDVIGSLDRFAQRVASTLGARSALTVPSGARGLWAWVPVGAEVRDVGGLRDEARAQDVRVAVGVPARGIEGFRRSHREALAARRIAGDRWITDYREVELLHLLSADPEGRDALVARELAGIDGADANSARLRDTLAAYLRFGGSPDLTGRVLGVHKNTVRYRVQRIEELLGHDVDSRRLHLELALLCAAGRR